MTFEKNQEIKKLKIAVENCCGRGLTQKSQLTNSLRIFNGRGICVLLMYSCARQNVLYLTTICQRTLSNHVPNIADYSCSTLVGRLLAGELNIPKPKSIHRKGICL